MSNVDTFHVHETREPMELSEDSTIREEKRKRSLGKIMTHIIYMAKSHIYKFSLEKRHFISV